MEGKIFPDSANTWQDQAKILFNYYRQAAERVVSEEERIEQEVAKLQQEKSALEQQISGLWVWFLTIILFFVYFIKKSALEKQIQECQTAISRCKAKQADAFEDYAEGRITRQEYLTRKAEAARQHDDMTALYMELSAKRVELQKAANSAEKMDLGRYACVGELTRELLTELIREIRVSGENDLEIVWNFRE